MATIKATANQSKRTFTIIKYMNGKLFAKYRTTQMNIEEFNDAYYNTEGDWRDFLNRVDGYYSVKK
jgi:hypothetical protein